MTEQTVEQRLDEMQRHFEKLDDEFRRHFHEEVGEESATPIVPVPFNDTQQRNKSKARVRKSRYHERRTDLDAHSVNEVAKAAREIHKGSTSAGSPPDRVWEAVAVVALEVAVSLVEIQQDEQAPTLTLRERLHADLMARSPKAIRNDVPVYKDGYRDGFEKASGLAVGLLKSYAQQEETN